MADDPGYGNLQEVLGAGKIAHVYLDDVPVEFCFMADEEAGQVGRYRLDASGGFVVDGDSIATETLTGKVRVDLR